MESNIMKFKLIAIALPISLALSANVFAEDRKLALDLGMNGHISKPIDMKKVRKVLHNILNAE